MPEEIELGEVSDYRNTACGFVVLLILFIVWTIPEVE